MSDRPIRWEYDKYRQPFAPRREPLPPPTTGIFESPTICLRINAAWVSHLLGVLEVLTQPDSWLGTDEQVYTAQQEVEKLIDALSTPCPDEINMIQDIRLNCDTGQLEALIDGVWVAKANLNQIQPSTYVQEFNYAQNGAIGWLQASNTPGCDFGAGQMYLNLPYPNYVSLVYVQNDQLIVQFSDGSSSTYDWPDGIPGPAGANGASPEMRVFEGWIQWRQDDDSPSWTNLVALADLQGAQGESGIDGINGASPEMRVSDGWIQWRQDDDNPSWTDLIALGSLVGPSGETVIVEPPIISGQTIEQDRCNMAGYYSNQILKDGMQQIVVGIQQNQQFVTIATGIVASLAGAATGGVLAPIIIGAFGTLFNAIVADVSGAEAALNDQTMFDAMACSMFCALDPDRAITAENMSRVVQAIRDTDHPSGWISDLATYFEQLGAPVISQASSAGVLVQYNCTNCDCDEGPDPNCIEVNFIVNNGGWTGGNAQTGYVTGGWRITSGSDDTLNINSTDRYTGTIIGVTVTLAAAAISQTRVYIQRNNGTKTQVATGAGPTYTITGLTYNLTNQTFGITVDYHPTIGSTHPQIVTSVEFCFTEPPVINP